MLLLALLASALSAETASPFEAHLLDAADLYALAQKSRNPARPATQTQCSVFFDQRVGGKASDSPYDTLLEVPLEATLSSEAAFAVHVSVNARFLDAPSSAGGALVGGDLVVALSDGERVLGFMRTTPRNDATSWGASLSASYAPRSLPAASVALDASVAPCVGDACAPEQRAGENFEVVFVLGRRTSVVGATPLAAGGAEFSDDLRGARALRVALYGAAPAHAFELGALEVRVEQLEREQSLAAFGSARAFVAATSPQRFAALWPAAALARVGGALYASERAHTLRADGCGVEFGAALGVPGVAYANLVALPLVGAGALRRDRQYVLHVAVTADSNTPRNQLLVAIADGLESGAHAVGFARGDRGAAPVLGAAFGGLLTRHGDALYIATSQFVALDAGVAGASAARRFEFDVVVGNGATRVVASASGALAAGDAFVDSDRFGLDLTAPLYVVAMQRAERSSESTTLRLLSVSIEEVRLGCDGVANSRLVLDACGVCGGHNACVGCDGVPLSGKLADACGVCGGDGSSCADCRGVPHGTSQLDDCGVCDGSNQCLLGTNADRNLAFRKAHGEKFANKDGPLLHRADDARSSVAASSGSGSGSGSEANVIYGRKRSVSGGNSNNASCTSGQCGDDVDCSGRLVREGGKLQYDACGVCGGNNACVGCDGVPYGKTNDACGKCGGTNTTCCVNYSDVSDAYWDFVLLPVTLDNLIEKLEATYATVADINSNLPPASRVDASVATQLQVGRMAEFNRIFLYDCLNVFCDESSTVFQQLVADNNPVAVIAQKTWLDLGSI